MNKILSSLILLCFVSSALSQPFLPFNQGPNRPRGPNNRPFQPFVPFQPLIVPNLELENFEWISSEEETIIVENGEDFTVIFEEATAVLTTDNGVEADVDIDVWTIDGLTEDPFVIIGAAVTNVEFPN